MIENNLEATIEGLKACTTCEDLVLIADNPATPRDMELLSKIDRPIHIILCGRHRSFNPAYLNLARSSGGTVHTDEYDFVNLDQITEGQKVTLGKEIFKVKDGKFVHVKYL